MNFNERKRLKFGALLPIVISYYIFSKKLIRI